MSQTRGKQGHDAGRRIAWLAVGVAAFVAAYSGGWFWFAGQVDEAVASYGQDRAQGASLACPGRDITGFPLRIGVFCESVELTGANGAFVLQAAAMRSSAVVYNPRHVIADIESPVTIAVPAGGPRYEIEWDQGRLSAITAPQAERMASLFADEARLSLPWLPAAVTAADFEAHLRQIDGALDIAASPRGVRIPPQWLGGRTLPEAGFDLDMRLADFGTDWAGQKGGGEGEINRLSLILTEDRGVILQGPFSVSPQGVISGAFELRVVDVPGVAAELGAVLPELVAPIEALTAGGQAGDEATLRLTVREGRVFAGIIPLGTLPRLGFGPFAGS
ncbi:MULTISPECIES: DUF2125 domain-containing protein [unclassified Roseitalea]|uniref:DUF2125 domain-containing protein n=1 Tax=unclassified Roseitalea TaxID=2639107 RepID=UPI00273EBB09|nr:MULTISPECIES: DUF2125 domain-containing protein [unclassified Roseitalea]